MLVACLPGNTGECVSVCAYSACPSGFHALGAINSLLFSCTMYYGLGDYNDVLKRGTKFLK